MARILTFLGKGGSGRTVMAIASAKKLATEGKRVLLVGQNPGPSLAMLLEKTLTTEPQTISENLQVVQLQTTELLEKSWEQLKALEKQYLRSPILKNVYGQELAILPGIDDALALNSIREYDASGKYDVIVYDGAESFATVRMFGIPEVLSWYIRRFRQLFAESDVGKAIAPFIQPITSAILNVSWSFDNLTSEPTDKTNQILSQGIAALGDPQRISAYLVIDSQPEAISSAKYLWGAAQQVGLTVAGVLLNQASLEEDVATQFSPLPTTSIPSRTSSDWQILIDTLPDLTTPGNIPQSLEADISKNQVRLFLPGFTKEQVKLTQSGPEITVEAGNQRRNLILPPALAGKPVRGAKFEKNFLILSF